jgi:hypothetical protein
MPRRAIIGIRTLRTTGDRKRAPPERRCIRVALRLHFIEIVTRMRRLRTLRVRLRGLAP